MSQGEMVLKRGFPFSEEKGRGKCREGFVREGPGGNEGGGCKVNKLINKEKKESKTLAEHVTQEARTSGAAVTEEHVQVHQA